MYLGIDVGSVSCNIVLINGTREIIEDHYIRIKGRPVEITLESLHEIVQRHSGGAIDGIAITGAGGKVIADILGVDYVNEIIAQSKATMELLPEVKTIIEIGGEDSKLIILEKNGPLARVRDFDMNTICAAGTGSFLDQQASRLNVSIEEFAHLALTSEKVPRIAGRCSVFAKTDMIHLQQEATPDYEIIAGLCYALIRNYRSNLGKNVECEKPISFQGGVAANAGIKRAILDVFELTEDELIIPEHYASMGAIGAVLVGLESSSISPFTGLEKLEHYLAHRHHDIKVLAPLTGDDYTIQTQPVSIDGGDAIEAYVGVDVGSISTNVVVIDKDKNVLARRYLMTAGRPLEAVTQGLWEVGEEIAGTVKVMGVCTTGSGRYLTGDFIGADIVKNEITAHATGAASFDEKVDTIFEIGGQDSKYISLEKGAVVDFTMNKVCAAGTGSFLEEQAERLGITIKEEFGALALKAQNPPYLGERCTVFMESDLNRHQQLGVSVENLVAGLSYSIVYNYLNKVVEDRKVGDHIFFQGGVAANRGVKAAFEAVTGKKVTVPPHHDVLGAIGCAILAMENRTWEKSTFRGFDLKNRTYTVSTFECKGCANLCEVKKVAIAGEKTLFYGSRCGKYDEVERESSADDLPELFKERQHLLKTTYPHDKPRKPVDKTIGIPQVAFYFEMFPFFKAFFTELGFEVVTSDDTNRSLITEGLAHTVTETCFPIKVAHGHVLNLLRKNPDYVFLPSIVNMPNTAGNYLQSYNCPLVQAMPYMLNAAIDFSRYDAKILQNVLHFGWGHEHINASLIALGEELGAARADVKDAIKCAFSAQEAFYRAIQKRGKEVLENLSDDDIAIVIVSRPYNGCDFALNLTIPDKLRQRRAIAIPMDMLATDDIDLSEDYKHMYWKYGQCILTAARMIKDSPNLNAIYITNYGCGPDSFISKFFSKEIAKPYLTIEVDEHSADAGVITRCEAFLDSIKNVRAMEQVKKVRASEKGYIPRTDKPRKIYIPYMDDHGGGLAAAMEACGLEAEQLPMADEKSLEIGLKYTSGKECYPAIITTGDLLKKVSEPGFDASRSAFFMPTSSGPCRFSQYNRFHRMILDELGYEDAEILVFDQNEDYHNFLSVLGGTKFKKLGWNAIVFTDMLQKLARQVRPYEMHAGEADALYEKILAKAYRLTRQSRPLVRLAKEARKRFSSIAVDKSEPRPLIGIVGEIYVRANQFANSFTIRKIEQFGGETSMSTIEEWIRYISYQRRVDYKRVGDRRGIVKDVITNLVQDFFRNRLARGFNGVIKHFLKEPSSEDVIEKGMRYLHPSLRGEAILSLAKAVEYMEENFDGIVNLVPFNCMPGAIVNAMLEKFKRDYGGVPVLKMSFDETEQASIDIRMEAFVHQARQHLLARNRETASNRS